MTLPASPTAKTRAVLIALVLCLHGFMATPLPRPVVRQHAPGSLRELANWRDQLAQFGVQVSNEQLVSWVKLGSAPALWRRTLLTPIRPVHAFTGVGQGWGFFAVPVTHPRRLEVYLLQGDEERLLFRRLDEMYDWRADWFADRHVRGVYDSIRGKKPTYKRFVRSVATFALEEFPAATGVRVQLVRTQTPHPTRPAATSEVKVLLAETVLRTDLP